MESIIKHVLDGALGFFRQDARALVERGNSLGAVAQGLGGVEREQVDDALAAPRTERVLAGIELGEDKQHLVGQGHLVDVFCRVKGAVKLKKFYRHHIPRLDVGF